MIKDFDAVKLQLEELAPIINSFSSEAVQLKIVELILSGQMKSDELLNQENNETDSDALRPKAKKKRTKKTPVRSKDSGAPRPTQKRSPGDGAPATLDKLVENGFFKQKRTIKDIIDHCEMNMARKFKQNEFSGKLARLVRSETLTRTKNEDGLYEYVSK